MLFLKQEIAFLITYNPTYHLTFELFNHKLRPEDRERWSLIALSPPPYNIETRPPKRWLLSFLIPEKHRFQLNQ